MSRGQGPDSLSSAPHTVSFWSVSAIKLLEICLGIVTVFIFSVFSCFVLSVIAAISEICSYLKLLILR